MAAGCRLLLNIEVHHIRKLADVAQKGKSERPDWMKKMAARRRKTLRNPMLESGEKIR